MATTGPAIYPGATTFPGATTYPGQGDWPVLWALYSTDDVSVTTPTWLDASSKVRAFSTSRGKDTEHDDVEAGTATATLDNRDRTFDPSLHSSIRPMNRWWLREQFAGATNDMFKGYAESYDNKWDVRAPTDAVCVVSCADEFKVLALAKLPTMSPPRDDYASYVQINTPAAYWRFTDPTMPAAVGSPLAGAPLAFSVLNETPIVGGKIGPFASGECGVLRLTSGQAVTGAAGDANGQGGTFFVVETWFRSSTAGSSGNTEILAGPVSTTSGTPLWRMLHNADGTVTFEVTDNSSVTHTAASVTPLVANAWTHIVGVLDDVTMTIYLNGAADNTGSFPGGKFMLDPANTTASVFKVGNASATYTRDYAELAIYKYPIPTAANILAHYTTGLTRGFAAGQLPGARMTAVLDTVASTVPRSIGAGANQMQGVFMTGQPPLDELRRSVHADAVDAMCFISRSGTIVFLAAAHRSSSPYNTVQATFDDDGTDLPYLDLNVDYSESFLANEWNVTKDGGVTQTASDSTSITRYYKRTQNITDMPVTLDADAATVAAAMLAKYKEPMLRVTSIVPKIADPATADNVFARDLGDRIRVLRTPPGGGARIDQQLFIQKITIDGSSGSPMWRVSWGVSPL